MNTQLRSDLESLGNKKRIADEERDRIAREVTSLRDEVSLRVTQSLRLRGLFFFIAQIRDKDSHIQQLNVHLAQSQADRQVRPLPLPLCNHSFVVHLLVSPATPPPLG